jgi:hypothetical protein
MDIDGIIIAAITVIGGSLAGIAALLKAGKEASKSSAEAANVLVDASGDVVKMLRENMADMRSRMDREEDRISHLEGVVGSWEGWADKVLDILDRAMSMLAEEQKTNLQREVERAKKTRPPRFGKHQHDEGARHADV